MVTNEHLPGSLGGESAKVLFQWTMDNGQWHQVWLGRGWCDQRSTWKGWLARGRAATSLAPTNSFRFPPSEHVLAEGVEVPVSVILSY